MDEKELYELIKDRRASNLFGDLEYQLDTAKPNSAVAHKLGGLRQYFSSIGRLYRDNYFPADETIAQYKERDASLFEEAINYILESMKFFNVHI
jgi:hypothetical protein